MKGVGQRRLEELNPGDLRNLFQKCAAVLCLEVPTGHDFGWGMRQWEVGPEFKGIKFVPPGLHMMHWGAGHGMRQGSFCELRPGDVLVKRWDPAMEDFYPGSGTSEEEEARLAHGVRRFDFDSGLGTLDPLDSEMWVKLARYIDAAVLQRCCVPLGTAISPGDAPSCGMGLDDSTVPNTQLVPRHEGVARAPRFSDVPSLSEVIIRRRQNAEPKSTTSASSKNSPELEGALLTAFWTDGTERLDVVLQHEFGGDERQLLGELQLAFVLFLQISSYCALEQWKKLIALICSAESAMYKRPAFFSEFVTVLRVQLEHTPTDLFLCELSADNFLASALRDLFEVAGVSASAAAVAPAAAPVSRTWCDFVRRVGKLRDFASSHFGRRALETALALPEDECIASQPYDGGGGDSDDDDDDGDDEKRDLKPLPALSLVEKSPTVCNSSTNTSSGNAPPERMGWMLPPVPSECSEASRPDG